MADDDNPFGGLSRAFILKAFPQLSGVYKAADRYEDYVNKQEELARKAQEQANQNSGNHGIIPPETNSRSRRGMTDITPIVEGLSQLHEDNILMATGIGSIHVSTKRTTELLEIIVRKGIGGGGNGSGIYPASGNGGGNGDDDGSGNGGGNENNGGSNWLDDIASGAIISKLLGRLIPRAAIAAGEIAGPAALAIGGTAAVGAGIYGASRYLNNNPAIKNNDTNVSIGNFENPLDAPTLTSDRPKYKGYGQDQVDQNTLKATLDNVNERLTALDKNLAKTNNNPVMHEYFEKQRDEILKRQVVILEQSKDLQEKMVRNQEDADEHSSRIISKNRDPGPDISGLSSGTGVLSDDTKSMLEKAGVNFSNLTPDASSPDGYTNKFTQADIARRSSMGSTASLSSHIPASAIQASSSVGGRTGYLGAKDYGITPRTAEEAFGAEAKRLGIEMDAGTKNLDAGNIKWDGTQWQGNKGPSKNLDEGTPQVTFDSPEMSMRAMALNLLNYQRKEKLTTIHDIASRYSPSNKAGAISNITGSSGIGEYDQVDFEKQPDLFKKTIRAFITQEHGPAGQLWTDDMIQKGIDLAEGKIQPINTGSQGQGQGVGAFSGDSSKVIEHLYEMKNKGLITNDQCVSLASAAVGIRLGSGGAESYASNWIKNGEISKQTAAGTPIMTALGVGNQPDAYGRYAGGTGGVAGIHRDHAAILTGNYKVDKDGKVISAEIADQYHGNGFHGQTHWVNWTGPEGTPGSYDSHGRPNYETNLASFHPIGVRGPDGKLSYLGGNNNPEQIRLNKLAQAKHIQNIRDYDREGRDGTKGYLYDKPIPRRLDSSNDHRLETHLDAMLHQNMMKHASAGILDPVEESMLNGGFNTATMHNSGSQLAQKIFADPQIIAHQKQQDVAQQKSNVAKATTIINHSHDARDEREKTKAPQYVMPTAARLTQLFGTPSNSPLIVLSKGN